MSEISDAFAKLAGVLKAGRQLLVETDGTANAPRPKMSFSPSQVRPYFVSFGSQLAILRIGLPNLFGDFAQLNLEPLVEMANSAKHYHRSQLQDLCRSIDQAFELRANSELSAPATTVSASRCVFISHGRAPDWREVQLYIEKDIEISTLELAQEPNQGRTVFQKLTELAGTCDYAVVVMTGDDQDASGNARTRENVMHEIGYFQGRFGPHRVCLLHEEGVSIPSNLFGLVYVPFPKGLVSAAFATLTRELRAAYH